MAEGRRVLVVGAGIAGLATARALVRHGLRVEVIERAAEWSHPGTGMYLPANSVRALDALGLRSALLDRAREIARQRLLDDQGRPLLEVDLAAVWGAATPCVGISRRALHEILCDGVPVRMGATLTALDQSGTGVQAIFRDGSSAAYDLVVAADGVRSWVRSAVFGGASARLVGQASWRFLAKGLPGVSDWTVRLGRGKAFLMLPLGRGDLYCYADLDAPGPGDPIEGRTERLCELFHEFAEPVPSMLKGLAATGERPYYSPIEEVVQVPWVRGRVVLVGDAAHAMSPNMAEGAGMALEDALVLAETIAAGRPLEAFEARRRGRVEFVRKQTHRRDATRSLPPPLRSAVLRLLGQRIFRANYGPLRDIP